MSELTINPIQKQAIEFAAGTMQVLAGPGSGKTFVITQRIRYLMEHYDVDPSKILVITFTKAAANEMKQRFYKLMEGKNPPVSFGTFHAIFYHILRQTGQYRKFTLITETEKRKLLLQLLQMPATQLLMENEKVDALIQLISQIKNNGEKLDDLKQEMFTEEELRELYLHYNQFLTEFQKMDFDDMGLLCLKLFQENPKILSSWQEKYRYILVDEFQDINPIQYQIVKYIAASEENLFIVGDDDQSIYGFRGARPDIMKQFMKDYPNARQLLLDINYRCHEEIVKSSLQVIDVNKNRFFKKIQAAHSSGHGVIVQYFPDKEEEYDSLVGALKSVYEGSQPELLSETAVIYRTNYECSLLAQKLLYQGIPFIMKEPFRSPYDHFVIKDLLAYLEFASGNRSREIFHLFMNRPLRYLRKDSARGSTVTLEELLAYYKDNVNMQDTARKLFGDIERISKMRPYLALHYIRKVIGYDTYLKETYDAASFEKLLQIAEDFQMTAKKYKSFSELNDYIGQCRELAKEKQKEEADAQDQKKIGVHLMTMHASKGLEFPTVYLPDVNEGKIPSRQSVTAEEIEEERRMFYVAMTRAKNDLYILFCKKEGGKDTPSRFLEPILKT